MKKNTKPVALLLLGFGLTTVQAQQAPNTSGGDASGSGGSVAYTVGQVGYTTQTGTTGSVAQGVQQPFEISIVLGIEENQISLNMQAYPNPTSNYLTLNIGDFDRTNLSFQLFDITGKLIETNKITKSIETIRMENLSSGSYFLKVTRNNKEVKTFKLIKN
ncbi:T9SS type A sorting domain-containing protein [Flavobacterium difficile]|uniref:T9SS type A sorting domain-containing protein n=1 Tax=Flavobacterium difficile TaxID=2709659 RepID=A0ABX0I518_9FLAO|nr:T9SS type A sorting domain-containing protein [Flavobacterium difficile]NHM00852.1 T9SS type A sorting domain-containing protein [Flavobacterium difficile]